MAHRRSVIAATVALAVLYGCGAEEGTLLIPPDAQATGGSAGDASLEAAAGGGGTAGQGGQAGASGVGGATSGGTAGASGAGGTSGGAGTAGAPGAGGTAAGSGGGEQDSGTAGSVGDAGPSDASIVSDAGADGPSPSDAADGGCQAVRLAAKAVPYHVLFLVDRSSTMRCNLPPVQTTAACLLNPTKVDQSQPSKWEITRDALQQMLSEWEQKKPLPSVGISYFNSDDSCGFAPLPSVEIGPLSGTSASDPKLNELVLSLNSVAPKGDRPIIGAVLSSYSYLHSQQASLAGNLSLVLLTGGAESCDPQAASKALLVQKAGEAIAYLGIRTYVLGAPGSESERALLSQVAYNGGTSMEASCDHSGAQATQGDCHFDLTLPGFDYATKLAESLENVGHQIGGCRFWASPQNPGAQPADADKVNVVVRDGQSVEHLVVRNDAASCGSATASGWQYSDSGTQIVLCGQSCEMLQLDSLAQAYVETGCPSVLLSDAGTMDAGFDASSPLDASADLNFAYDAPALDAAEACASSKVQAALRPLDLYLMVDRTSSLAGAGWSNQSAALKSFFQDPGSAGLTVALRFFPLDDGPSPQNASCSGDAYAAPLVGWGLLPANASALALAIDNTAAAGVFTPTQEALQGVLQGAVARKNAAKDHVVAAVLASDGPPCCSACPLETGAALANLAAQYLAGTPSIRTYTLYLAPSAQSVLSAIAASGGTTTAYNVSSGTQAYLNALRAIHGAAVPCSFDLPVPDGGVLDPTQVVVRYLAGGSSVQPLQRVQDPSSCGMLDGWYYDNNAAPTEILLCPQPCSTMKSDPGAKIEIDFGCLTP